MNSSMLLFGILPLIVFVIVDSFAGLRAGVIAGVIFAIAEAAYTVVVYKTIDELTIASTVLVLVFGALSYKSKKDIYFKLQPVVLGVLLGLAFLVMQLMGKPLMVMMMQKYQFIFPEDMRAILLSPELMVMMAHLSGILGFGFLIHAALVGYSAFKMNKWWWLIIRGVGFYVMLFACAILARLMV